MSTQGTPLSAPTPFMAIAKHIADHNPFYLLSGVFMLVGCYLLNSAVHAQPDNFSGLLLLLFVINGYEAMLIGLAIYLSHTRALTRDCRQLTVLALLLAVDATCLYSEAATTSAAASSTGAANR